MAPLDRLMPQWQHAEELARAGAAIRTAMAAALEAEWRADPQRRCPGQR
jgi:hypothetical protein